MGNCLGFYPIPVCTGQFFISIVTITPILPNNLPVTSSENTGHSFYFLRISTELNLILFLPAGNEKYTDSPSYFLQLCSLWPNN